jgi:hypothetical protein
MKKYAYLAFTTVITLSTTCMELNLEERHNIQEEQKPFLQTNNLTKTNNSCLANQLYKAARDYMHCVYHDTYSMKHHKLLVDTIVLMNKAKSNNITEDFMGKLAYKCGKKITSLFFSCLKKYMITISTTKEQLPFDSYTLYTNTKLPQALNLPYKNPSEEEIKTIPFFHPAYINLSNTTHKIERHHSKLCDCLYSNTKILFDDYPEYNDVTDFSDFYHYARDLSIPYELYEYWPDCDSYISNVLNLIERIKKIEHTSSQKDICHKILNFDPTQTFKGIIRDFFLHNYATVTKKNFLVILYTFAEKYNHARGDKKTPTYKQYKACLYQKNLDLALPDDVDATLFDDNMYAFAEFSQLIDNVKILAKADAYDRQQCVNQLYF